jgi:N-acetylmuramoyl-L-alanine amidase
MGWIRRFVATLALVLVGCAGVSGWGQGQAAPAAQTGQAPSTAPVGQTATAPVAPTPRAVIVIDAAHGGEDGGAQLGNGALEKNITLAISVRLRSLLSARGIYVVTTRESDVTLDATRRVEIANHAGAEACVSIHATSSGVGIHLFTSSLAPTAATRIAPWRTAQSAWIPKSLALAGVVNSSLQQAGFSVSIARTNLPGLDSMTSPAIAIELATPSGDGTNDAPMLTDPAYQAHVAELLAAALVEWRSEARRP